MRYLNAMKNEWALEIVNRRTNINNWSRKEKYSSCKKMEGKIDRTEVMDTHKLSIGIASFFKDPTFFIIATRSDIMLRFF